MDWLHCFKCGLLPEEAESHDFYISSCGHLLCRKCCEKSAVIEPGKCPDCKKDGSQLMKIGSDMNPEVRKLFQSPMDQIAKALRRMREISSFQQSQAERLKGVTERQLEKARELFHRHQHESKRANQYMKEIDELKKVLTQQNDFLKHQHAYRKQLEARIQGMQSELTAVHSQHDDVTLRHLFDASPTVSPGSANASPSAAVASAFKKASMGEAIRNYGNGNSSHARFPETLPLAGRMQSPSPSNNSTSASLRGVIDAVNQATSRHDGSINSSRNTSLDRMSFASSRNLSSPFHSPAPTTPSPFFTHQSPLMCTPYQFERNRTNASEMCLGTSASRLPAYTPVTPPAQNPYMQNLLRGISPIARGSPTGLGLGRVTTIGRVTSGRVVPTVNSPRYR